jgi:hypothetical protein
VPIWALVHHRRQRPRLGAGVSAELPLSRSGDMIDADCMIDGDCMIAAVCDCASFMISRHA